MYGRLVYYHIEEHRMPNKLYINDEARAKRHVLGQQLYRLRRRYRFLLDEGLIANAMVVRTHIRYKEQEYINLGGRPHHAGNVL